MHHNKKISKFMKRLKKHVPLAEKYPKVSILQVDSCLSLRLALFKHKLNFTLRVMQQSPTRAQFHEHDMSTMGMAVSLCKIFGDVQSLYKALITKEGEQIISLKILQKQKFVLLFLVNKQIEGQDESTNVVDDPITVVLHQMKITMRGDGEPLQELKTKLWPPQMDLSQNRTFLSIDQNKWMNQKWYKIVDNIEQLPVHHINLRMNKMSSLLEDLTMIRMPYLKDLLLSDNYIDSIEVLPLIQMRSLQSLDLHNNYITCVRPLGKVVLPELINLNLWRNHIVEFSGIQYGDHFNLGIGRLETDKIDLPKRNPYTAQRRKFPKMTSRFYTDESQHSLNVKKCFVLS